MDASFARTTTAITLGVLLGFAVVAEVFSVATPITPSLIASAAGALTLIAGLLGWLHFGPIVVNPPPEVRYASLRAGAVVADHALSMHMDVTNRSGSPWWIEQVFFYDDAGRRVGSSVDRRKLEGHEEISAQLRVSPTILSGLTRMEEAEGGIAYSSVGLQPYHVLDGAMCVEVDFVDSRSRVFRLNLPVSRDLKDVTAGTMAAHERQKGVVWFRSRGFRPEELPDAWTDVHVEDPEYLDLGDVDLDDVIRRWPG